MKNFLVAVCLTLPVLNSYAQSADSLRTSNAKAVPAVTAAAVAVSLNAGLTELLKNTIHKTRPDGSDRHSFPSRHSSWAFAVTTTLSNEFYQSCPWLPLVGQLASSGVGIQRIHKRRHSGTDVAAGLALGVGCAEVGSVVSRLIFGGPSPWISSVSADFSKSISVSSDYIIPLNGSFGRGFGTSVSGTLPLGKHFGVMAEAECFCIPTKNNSSPMEGIGLLVGCVGYNALGTSPLALEGVILAGVDHLHYSIADIDTNPMRLQVRAGVEWQLSRRFKTALNVGYGYFNGPLPLNVLTVSCRSAWCF